MGNRSGRRGKHLGFTLDRNRGLSNSMLTFSLVCRAHGEPQKCPVISAYLLCHWVPNHHQLGLGAVPSILGYRFWAPFSPLEILFSVSFVCTYVDAPGVLCSIFGSTPKTAVSSLLHRHFYLEHSSLRHLLYLNPSTEKLA